MSDADIDRHLDAVLKASGSALRHYTMPRTLAAMRAAMREAIKPSIPAGWRLVPVVPTQKMLYAGRGEINDGFNHAAPSEEMARMTYESMLCTAPRLPAAMYKASNHEPCGRCGGRGWTEEGDPETGHDPQPCGDCSATESSAAPQHGGA